MGSPKITVSSVSTVKMGSSHRIKDVVPDQRSKEERREMLLKRELFKCNVTTQLKYQEFPVSLNDHKRLQLRPLRHDPWPNAGTKFKPRPEDFITAPTFPLYQPGINVRAYPTKTTQNRANPAYQAVSKKSSLKVTLDPKAVSSVQWSMLFTKSDSQITPSPSTPKLKSKGAKAKTTPRNALDFHAGFTLKRYFIGGSAFEPCLCDRTNGLQYNCVKHPIEPDCNSRIFTQFCQHVLSNRSAQDFCGTEDWRCRDLQL